MNILVLGGDGQLGQSIAKVAALRQLSNITFTDKDSLDILDPKALEAYFSEKKPEIVVNCAAYTAVDKAEEQEEIADALNHLAAGYVATACRATGIPLIHISTDFVFEGNVPKMLNEQDTTEPLSIYGLTKLKGEQAVVANLDEHIIIRTSWLYSEFAGNFAKTMIRLGSSRPELGIIADQTGTPTYAPDLAAVILDIAQAAEKKYGIYHYSNEGALSWYDFAQAIFELAGISVKVNALKTSEYPTPARRPAYSVMDKTKIKTDYSVQVPYWRESLKVCISALDSVAS